mgnify:FL=1
MIDPAYLLDQLGLLPEREFTEEEAETLKSDFEAVQRGECMDASEALRQIREEHAL